MPGVAAAGEAGSSMPDRPTDGRAMTEFSKRGAKVESWFQGETGRMYNVVQVGAERCTVCRCAHMYSAASAPSAVSGLLLRCMQIWPFCNGWPNFGGTLLIPHAAALTPLPRAPAARNAPLS